MRERVAPSRCEGLGYHPRKIFENSDAKSYILVTTDYAYCSEISCLLKTTAKIKLGTNLDTPIRTKFGKLMPTGMPMTTNRSK